MYRQLFCAGVAFTALGFASVAHALFLIDNFSDNPTVLTNSSATGATGNYAGTSSAWLGSRAFTLGHFPSSLGGVSTAKVDNGFYGSNTPEAGSNARVHYGLAGIDLANNTVSYFPSRNVNVSSFTGVRVTVLAAKAGTRLRWAMFDDNATGITFAVATHFLASDVNAPTTIDLAFSDLVYTGAFTTSAVDDAFFDVRTFDGNGFVIQKIEFVPEPAAMLTLGVGAAGLLRRRRKS